MRELEIRNAVERKKLMQALLEHLIETGVKAEMQSEPAINCLGEQVLEPVINLKEQNLNKIHLVGTDSGGCNVPGNILRFQYEVHPDKELSVEEMKGINSFTRVVKEGKILSYFGGKVVGITWVGQKLAEALNQDQSIVDDLLRCVKSWRYLEFQIEAVSPAEISIVGPRFSSPGAIADLYHSEHKGEIQCCAFGFTIMKKIAGHIKTTVS